LNKLATAKEGEVYKFFYRGENPTKTPRYRLAKINKVAHDYVGATDLEIDEPRNFKLERASYVVKIADSHQQVVHKQEAIDKLLKVNTPNIDLDTLAKLYKNAEDVEVYPVFGYDLLVITPKNYPILKVELNEEKDSFVISFVNQKNEELVLKSNSSEVLTLELKNKDGVVTQQKDGVKIEDFVEELTNHYGI
jgi:hypothetical protein